jgi:hypothetical protein
VTHGVGRAVDIRNARPSRIGVGRATRLVAFALIGATAAAACLSPTEIPPSANVPASVYVTVTYSEPRPGSAPGAPGRLDIEALLDAGTDAAARPRRWESDVVRVLGYELPDDPRFGWPGADAHRYRRYRLIADLLPSAYAERPSDVTLPKAVGITTPPGPRRVSFVRRTSADTLLVSPDSVIRIHLGAELPEPMSDPASRSWMVLEAEKEPNFSSFQLSGAGVPASPVAVPAWLPRYVDGVAALELRLLRASWHESSPGTLAVVLTVDERFFVYARQIGP